MKFEMPAPNSEINSNVKMRITPLSVDSNSEEVTDIILLNSNDANMDTFSEIPLEFDSSNSSIGTLDSVDDSAKMEASLPMLTDIAEETIYETEFFDETLQLEDSLMKESKDTLVQEHNDISNILMETVTAESSESSVENDFYYQSANIDITDTESLMKEGEDDDFLDSEILETVSENVSTNFEVDDEHGTKFSSNDYADNGVLIATATPLSSANSSTTEVSNLITVSNNTNLVSGILGNTTLNNLAAVADKMNNINVEFLTTTPKSTVYTNLANVIQINAINSKISTLQPITVQSAPKLVPLSIASANAIKRPATISIGPAGASVLTKVIVSQGKSGQPIRILPNSVATSSSPVKTITAAQAKQMGIKLQPIRPSTTKNVKQKLILSNIPPGAQVLKKVQSIPKPATPTKILPAPLVSKSGTGSQSQKIMLHPDYLMKTGAIIPKVTAGQMILSNLKSTPIVSNHSGSPKKQVQYIKLINNVGSTNLPTVTSAKGKFTAVTQNSTIAKIDKDTPIIVAAPNFSSKNLNIKTTNNVSTNLASTGNITVLPALPTPTVKSVSGQRLILPAVTKTTETVDQFAVGTEMKQTKSSGNVVYLPDEVIKKIQTDLLSTPVKLKEEQRPTSETTKISHDNQEAAAEARPPKSPPRYSSTSFEAGGGLKSRKPCNCTRSQCLKLYCECFANGEFCNNCNCTSCHNNISHEENRQNAIRSCLDRNPQAFRPKIGKCLVGLSDRRHTKGCHCKRSGCLKNYCECYEAQIPCSDNCKCIGCKNIDDGLFTTSCLTNSNNNFDKSDQPFEFQTFSKNKLTAEINDAVGRSGPANPRHAFSFIKDQVVEATCQCLLAQAEDVKRRKVDDEDGKKYILEEFGRCLIQIIECAPDRYVSS